MLRKKPAGRLVSKTAHRVEREYRVIAALGAATAVPVPAAYALCTDAAVLGTPFYLMAFVDGRVLEDAAMPGASARDRRAMWADAVRTLARLHAVDPAAVGLADFGPRDGPSFYARQVRTWAAICAAQAAVRDVDSREPVGPLPHFDALIAFFSDPARMPRDRRVLVHGDYKIDNLVFHPARPAVVAVLDWEMSTIGHPLADLTNFLTPHAAILAAAPAGYPAKYTALPQFHPAFRPGATAGLPTAREIVDLYCRAAGWPDGGWPDMARELRWAAAFNMFRQAAIFQGIAARAAVRQASSEKAEAYASSRAPLADLAWDMVSAALADEEEAKRHHDEGSGSISSDREVKL